MAAGLWPLWDRLQGPPPPHEPNVPQSPRWRYLRDAVPWLALGTVFAVAGMVLWGISTQRCSLSPALLSPHTLEDSNAVRPSTVRTDSAGAGVGVPYRGKASDGPFEARNPLRLPTQSNHREHSHFGRPTSLSDDTATDSDRTQAKGFQQSPEGSHL